MQLGFAIFIFALGLIVGSFLNVVVFRLNTSESIVKGRSRCFSCGKTLCTVDLIPVLSFLWQRGRCRYCGSKISSQYILVELITGLTFLLAGYSLWGLNAAVLFRFPVVAGQGILAMAIFALLIAIAAYDLRHKIIPNQLVYTFIALALVFGILSNGNLIENLLAGLGAFSFFALLWGISGGRWMGFGDAKLALGIGFFLGSFLTPVAVTLAFWIGMLVSLPLLIMQNNALKLQIPFAPFLVAATIITWAWGVYIIEWYLSLF